MRKLRLPHGAMRCFAMLCRAGTAQCPQGAARGMHAAARRALVAAPCTLDAARDAPGTALTTKCAAGIALGPPTRVAAWYWGVAPLEKPG